MNDTQPLVSIGIPVFNAEKTLRQALDSLLGQSYANLELIISDNASADGTESICREYVGRDSRVRYIRQPENLGPYKNFDIVLQEARGEYFMWAADDDRWAPEYIHTLLDALKKKPLAAGAFTPFQLIEDETGEFYGGVWRYNYQSSSAFFRLLKFTRYYDDRCFYGLMRKTYLGGENFSNLFKPWSWINSVTPYNSAYPLLYFLLAGGDMLLVGDEPLWFKSVRLRRSLATPFAKNPLLGYLSHIVRKVNLFKRAAHSVYLGSKSLLLALGFTPFLFLRMLYDCATPVYAVLYIRLSGKKISDFSPHEIWRLGVR